MTTEPNDLLPELIAAYADGELGPRDRAHVERWLADHPEAGDRLETQESLGPRNADLWAGAPEPSTRQWAACLHGIEDRVRPSSYRVWVAWSGAMTLFAAAAAVFLVVAGADRPGPPSGVLPAVPSVAVVAADEVPYPMATSDDVRIISLPEAAAHLLIVGEHPLRESLVLLANADEVEIFGVGSDLAGRFPDLPTDPDPDDRSVLWAPR